MKLDRVLGETGASRQHARSIAIPARDHHELTDHVLVDVHAFREQCMGNTAFALTLLDEFMKTGDDRIASLRHAADGAVLPKLVDIAHALKGVAGIFSARKLCELCGDLEAAAAARDIARSRHFVQRLCEEICRCLDYMSTIRPGLSEHQATP